MNDAFQITNAQTNVRHQSFDLMKFSQMCGVHGFIAKNTVLFQQCQQKNKRAGKKKNTKQFIRSVHRTSTQTGLFGILALPPTHN